MSVMGFEIGEDICNAFELEANKVRNIHINIGTSEEVTINVEFLPDREQMKKVSSIFKEFNLVVKKKREVLI